LPERHLRVPQPGWDVEADLVEDEVGGALQAWLGLGEREAEEQPAGGAQHRHVLVAPRLRGSEVQGTPQQRVAVAGGDVEVDARAAVDRLHAHAGGSGCGEEGEELAVLAARGRRRQPRRRRPERDRGLPAVAGHVEEQVVPDGGGHGLSLPAAPSPRSRIWVEIEETSPRSRPRTSMSTAWGEWVAGAPGVRAGR